MNGTFIYVAIHFFHICCSTCGVLPVSRSMDNEAIKPWHASTLNLSPWSPITTPPGISSIPIWLPVHSILFSLISFHCWAQWTGFSFTSRWIPGEGLAYFDETGINYVFAESFTFFYVDFHDFILWPFLLLYSNASWDTLGHIHTDKQENIWHICRPHYVQVHRLHLTEVAVFHPVYYINWSGRRPSPCWEPNMMWYGLTHHDVSSLCWLQALWWSLVLYLTACSYPDITLLFFDRGKNSMRCKTQTQLSAGVAVEQLHFCMLGDDEVCVTLCHTCAQKNICKVLYIHQLTKKTNTIRKKFIFCINRFTSILHWQICLTLTTSKYSNLFSGCFSNLSKWPCLASNRVLYR